MNYVLAYGTIFIAGFLSCQLGIVVIGGSWFESGHLGFFAGLAATLSALLISKSYLFALQAGAIKALYLKTILGTLLSHLLFGVLMAVQDINNFGSALVLYAVVSAVFGFIPNLLFSFSFTTFLINYKNPRTLA